MDSKIRKAYSCPGLSYNYLLSKRSYIFGTFCFLFWSRKVISNIDAHYATSNSRQGGYSGIISSKQKASFLLSSIWVKGRAAGVPKEGTARAKLWRWHDPSLRIPLSTYCVLRSQLDVDLQLVCGVHLRAYVFMTRIPRDRGWTFSARFHFLPSLFPEGGWAGK